MSFGEARSHGRPTGSKGYETGQAVPWLYLLPSLIVMTFFIVYPMINTIGLSLLNKDGTASAATTCRPASHAGAFSRTTITR